MIAKKAGRTLVVQCKKYSAAVGNALVQEVIAAKNFLRADYAAVVTNSTYTKSAIELATKADVLLFNHTERSEIDKQPSTAHLLIFFSCTLTQWKACTPLV